MIKPLFKWTGGKNRMMKKYGADFWPNKDVQIFVDAFYGGGAVTHWAWEKYPNAHFVINDANKELIQLYTMLRDETESFISHVAAIENDFLSIPPSQKEGRKAFYNGVKLSYINHWETMGKLKESATLYFLMKTSFNGWWKVYNYSHGRYATPPGTVHQKEEFIDKELLRDTAEFLRERVTLMCGDFENVQRYADIETVGNTYFYFDPPYRDSSTKYTTDGFDDTDQIRLCELMQYCDMKGGMVSMSNKEIGDGFWHDHVGNMEILEYDAKYTAGRGTTTNDVKEVLIRNFEISQGPLSTLFV